MSTKSQIVAFIIINIISYFKNIYIYVTERVEKVP